MISQQKFDTARACDDGRLSSGKAHASACNRRVALVRVSEYEEWGVAQKKADAACLAAFQAELFRAAFSLEGTMQQIFSRCRSVADGVPAAELPINQYLRVLRQIEQNVRLELAAR